MSERSERIIGHCVRCAAAALAAEGTVAGERSERIIGHCVRCAAAALAAEGAAA